LIIKNKIYLLINLELFYCEKGKIMRLILIIAAIVLLVVGIAGLLPQFGWAHVQLWRAVLEIVVGGLVLLIGVRTR
jgi:hypothetical protein